MDAFAEFRKSVGGGVELGGQIGGTLRSPTIVGFRESAGPETIGISTVEDGEYLVRRGSSIIGSTAASVTGLYPISAIGINLGCISNEYSEREFSPRQIDVLMRFFKDSGIKIISIRIIWSHMEPDTQGVLSTTYMDALKTIAESAQRFNISIMLDFHQAFQPDHFNIPDWWGATPNALTAMVLDDVHRDYFLSLVKRVCQPFYHYPAVRYVQLFNEPHGNTSPGDTEYTAIVNGFNALFPIAVTAAKNALPGARMGIRFLSTHQPWCVTVGRRFDAAAVVGVFDWVGINCYDTALLATELVDAIPALKAGNVPIGITEFGFTSTDPADKATFFASAIPAFHAAMDPFVMLAWQYDVGSDLLGYNLVDTNDVPNAGFTELSNQAKLPRWVVTGDYTTAASNTNITIAYPTANKIHKNDTIFLHFTHSSNATQLGAVYTFPLAAGFTPFSASISGNMRSWIFYKTADGTESGTVAITRTGGTGSATHQGVMHVFRGPGGPLLLAKGLVTNDVSGTNVFDAGVVTPADNGLALNFCALSVNENIAAFTGQTGGTWELATQGTGAARIGLQIARMPTAGHIDGGVFVAGSATNWISRGVSVVAR